MSQVTQSAPEQAADQPDAAPTFYVDGLIWPDAAGKKWCHLMTPGTDDQLRAFAARLGLKAAWIQYAGTEKAHFDLTEPKRRKAVDMGALPVSSVEMHRQVIGPKRLAIKDAKEPRPVYRFVEFSMYPYDPSAAPPRPRDLLPLGTGGTATAVRLVFRMRGGAWDVDAAKAEPPEHREFKSRGPTLVAAALNWLACYHGERPVATFDDIERDEEEGYENGL